MKVDVVQAERKYGQTQFMRKIRISRSSVAECTSYKQDTKILGYAADEDDMNQLEEHEF